MMCLNPAKFFVFTITMILGLAACGRSEHSIYQDLPEEEDGVVSGEIDGDGVDEVSKVSTQNELSETEKKLVKSHLRERYTHLSFLVVNAKTKGIVKSYYALKPQKLASVTKMATALAALENDKRAKVGEIADMLRQSHNGIASQYVRSAALSIDGTTVYGTPFTAAHSCPTSIRLAYEAPAAQSVFKWIQSKNPEADWKGAALKDGAGCSHENKFTALQTIELIQFADSLGFKYEGKSFADLLSVAGIVGTWRARNKESKGMIFAKTGTLGVASNLAGFFIVKRGGQMHRYYFAVFIEKDPARDTTASSRQLIEGLVRHWVQGLAKEEVLLAGNL